MQRTLWFIVLSMIIAVVIAGCAGVRPAVQPAVRPTVETPQEQNPETSEEVVQEEVVVVVDEQPQSEAIEETPAQEETTIDSVQTMNDELELPDDAMPKAPVAVTPVNFLPNGGPLPAGDEPQEMSDGWRVQVASVSQHETAEQIRADLKAKYDSLTVPIRFLGDAYTVLIGNYAVRAEAEALRDELLRQGYDGAFVVKAPISTPPSPPSTESPPVPPAEPKLVEIDGWRVQVMSVTNRSAAMSARNNVAKKTDFGVYVEEIDGSWKVRVGDFRTRSEASAARADLVENGFEGAFPVETRILVPEEASEE